VLRRVDRDDAVGFVYAPERFIVAGAAGRADRTQRASGRLVPDQGERPALTHRRGAQSRFCCRLDWWPMVSCAPSSKPSTVYGGAAGVSAQTSAGSHARGRAVTTSVGRPRCSRSFLAVALSVIAARGRR
jgi:hypothetical protein